MRRRAFIAGLGSAAAWPVVARAQQRTIPVVGVLGSATADAFFMPAFMQGLKEAGFIEGQNLAFEQRWANNQYDRLPEMAADLVRARVSLIVAIGNNLPARAAKAATSTIPIVFSMGADPVALGLVANLQPPWRKHHRRYQRYHRDLAKALAVAPHLGSKRSDVLGTSSIPDNVSSLATVIDPVRDAVRTWGGTVEVAYCQGRT